VIGIASTVQQTMQAAVRSSSARPGCSQTAAQNDNSAQPFHWNGRVAPQLIEITGRWRRCPPAADIELKLLAARQAKGQADWSDLAAMMPGAARRSISITRRRHEDSGRWNTRPRLVTAREITLLPLACATTTGSLILLCAFRRVLNLFAAQSITS
jgi:hypothetical protein